jgi:Cd2+/Zn2+-exporting ATPase
MDCADCAVKLEKGVGRLAGVESCAVNFAASRMNLSYDAATVDRDAIVGRIRALGYDVASDSRRLPTEQSGGVAGLLSFLRGRRRDTMTLVAGLLTGLAFALDLFGFPSTVVHAGYGVAILAGGYFVAQKGVRGVWINHSLDINFLMSIAAVGAVAIGAWEEGALVMFLFSLGETLESYTMDRARNSIRSLMDLSPAEATLLSRGAGEPGSWGAREQGERVAVDDLLVGDVILVRPGERIPMDGRIVKGQSAVDQSPITGESIAVSKVPDDEVFAGTINQSGALEIAVTHRAADNTLSRLIQMVEEAQAQRAPTQRWVDAFARYYTPAVVALAVLMAAGPPLIFGQPFWEPVSGPHGWLYRALALLVIACPCALVISTPVSIVSAISSAARNGVLVKGGAYLEAAGALRVIAFDKTGTLTRGLPAVSQIQCADGCCADERVRSDGDVNCGDCNDVLALAAAVESRSEHPLARAITQAAVAGGLSEVYGVAEDVTALAGRGVRGRVNGKQVTVGSHQHFDLTYPHRDFLCQQIDAAEANGQTTMLVHDGDSIRGFIAVADQVRPSSVQAIARLREAGIERIIMLTGDNESTAQAIGAEVGVDEARANLLPEDKVNAVKALLDEYGQVAMVGDGVNDAPALAAATVGIAMGGAGTDQALETADIALMADDLRKLPFAIELSRRTRSIIRQNVALSLLIKAVFMALALPGLATLWMAVFADMGASLIVTLNGMRLMSSQISDLGI